MKTFKIVIPFAHPTGYYWCDSAQYGCEVCQQYGAHWRLDELDSVKFEVEADTQDEANLKVVEMRDSWLQEHEEEIAADMGKWFKWHNSRDWPRDFRGRPLFLDRDFDPNVEVEK